MIERDIEGLFQSKNGKKKTTSSCFRKMGQKEQNEKNREPTKVFFP